jgi:hypothetical protein
MAGMHAGDTASPASPTETAGIPRLVLKSLRVEADRVVAAVVVEGAASSADTNPRIAARAIAERPNLPIHTCVNGEGPLFGSVIDHTPLPHLLEHVVVDLQTAACPNPDRVFTGATRWTDGHPERARVEVSYADDIAALRAFRDAVDLVNRWVELAVVG